MKRYRSGTWDDFERLSPDEASFDLIVNNNKIVTIQCSPDGYENLGVGFLYTNGVINNINEIESMRFSNADSAFIVNLCKNEFQIQQRLTVTTGFGGGLFSAFDAPENRVESEFSISPDKIIDLMSIMKSKAIQYMRSGGIHAAAICSREEILFIVEDVGRQNSMDKVIGCCLNSGISLDDKALLTTGRISFEMVVKTMRAGIPVLASLSTPTLKAIDLASRNGIAIAGYLVSDGFIAYTNESRFQY